jgi:hypothetical protein
VGWDLSCEFVRGRITYGTMRVIWDGHIWSTEQRTEWQKVKSTTNPHRDHIHVEQFWQAARRPLTVTDELTRALAEHRHQTGR